MLSLPRVFVRSARSRLRRESSWRWPVVGVAGLMLSSGLMAAAGPVAASDLGYELKASWPGPVLAGDPASVSGVVKRGARAEQQPYAVLLEVWDPYQDIGEGWQPVTGQTLTSNAPSVEFTFTIPTADAGETDYRVAVEGTVFGAYDTAATDEHTMQVTQLYRSATASWMADATVRVGAERWVSGEVRDPDGQLEGGVGVAVQQREHNGTWRTVETTISRSDGSYTATVPTHFYHSGRWRVATVDEQRIGPGVAARTGSQTVRPSYKPIGKAARYDTYRGTPHWDGCRPIRYRLNLDGHYKWSLKVAKKVFRQVERASGLTFEHLGSTDYIAGSRSAKTTRWPSGTDLTMSWATPRQVRPLKGGVVGIAYATPMDAVYTDGTEHREIVRGGVALDKSYKFWGSAKKNKQFAMSVMMHELAHALGLDHVDDPQQIMNPAGTFEQNWTKFSAGDLTGLNKVGAQAGCFERSQRASSARPSGASPAAAVIVRH